MLACLKGSEEWAKLLLQQKWVAKAEWLAVPFLLEDDYDHYYLIEQLKTRGEWKALKEALVLLHLMAYAGSKASEWIEKRRAMGGLDHRIPR